MKQFITRLSFLAVLLSLSVSLYAQIFEVDGISYYVTSSRDLTVLGIPKEYSGEVKIPESVYYKGESYNVKSISSSAFQGCSGLTSVTIPNSVTSILGNAFEGCSGLTFVTIGNSVKSIPYRAFYGCSSLISVTIGNKVTSIDWKAFSGCSSLISVTIPNSVTSIGDDAFEDCSSLTSVTIPNSVTSISSHPFYGCSGLTSVTINCKNVGSWFSGLPSINEVVLGDSVTFIGYGAFQGCSGLTSVTIGNSVTSIGNHTFDGCSSLTSVTIPNSVTSIGDYAFEGCSGLTSVIIPNSVISINNHIFEGCSSLISVTIPNIVTSIGDYAFYGCSSLTSVTIPNSVTSIGDYAFYGCSSLTSVTIPNSVTSIRDYAFYGCSSLTSVTINCKNVGSWFRGKTSIKEVVFGDSVTNIGYGAFQGCSGLTSVTIGNSVKVIDNYALPHNRNMYIKLLSKIPPKLELGFDEKYTFGKIEVPKGSACKYALANNWQKSDTIFVLDGKTYLYPILIIREGDNVVSIKGDNVVSINGNVEGYEAKEGEEVTIEAYSLNNRPLVMKVTQNISNILSEKGSFTFKTSIYHSDNVIYTYDFPLTNITLSETGTLIDNVNIDNILDIENLKISGDINGTDLLVIRKMENLKLLDLGEAHIVEGGMSYYENYVTSKNRIGNYFFSNNKKLYTVILPQDITEICEYSFCWLSELRTIFIPKSVKKMNSSIFSSCDNLHSIHIEDLAAYCSIKFSHYTWKNRSRDMYLNDKKIVDMVIPEGVTNISSYAFYELNGLNSLVIPRTVTNIGTETFHLDIDKSITSLNPIPPEITENTFGLKEGVPLNAPPNYMSNYERVTLYVPKGSKTLYWLHPGWENFKNIVELDESGINDVIFDSPTMVKGVYTIDGVKVSTDTDNVKNLPKGIYIINGEKVIIK